MIRTTLRVPAALAALVMSASLLAARPLDQQMTLRAESKLWFDGTSTVRNWTCSAKQLDVVVNADANASTGVLAGTKAVKSVQLTVPVDQLDCNGNRTMNGHMWKALKADEHKTIAFALTDYSIAAGNPTAGTISGTLTLNGQTRPISFPVEYAAASGALRVTGAYALKMTDWGVQPPTLMLGTMKVGEVTNVQFDLLLQQ